MENLSIKHLSKSYKGKKVIDDVSFNLSGNKIYGLFGRNGVGKSTLLNCVCDRLLIDKGNICLGKDEIHNNDKLLHNLYLMNTDISYSGREKVTDLYRYVDISYKKFNYEYAHLLAKKFGIDEKQKLKNLSTGLRTAAEIILAFCVNAKFILLDEPTLGLDASLRNVFYQELIKTYTKQPRTFVIATHQINEIQNLIEDVMIMKDRKFLFDGSVKELQEKAIQLCGPKELVLPLVRNKKYSIQYDLGKEIAINIEADELEGKDIPNNVKVKPLDLQSVFTFLTMGE